MEAGEVYRKLTSVFQDVFADDTMVINAGLAAKDVAGWDSLNHIRLMLSVQKAFGVKFTAHEIAQLKNVGQLADLVQKKS